VNFLKNSKGEIQAIGYLGDLAGTGLDLVISDSALAVKIASGVKYDLLFGYLAQSSDGDFTSKDKAELAGGVIAGLLTSVATGALTSLRDRYVSASCGSPCGLPVRS